MDKELIKKLSSQLESTIVGMDIAPIVAIVAKKAKKRLDK